MIYINEWLPNPLGSDTQNEWIELWNSGAELVNLAGWRLENSTTGKFSLKSGEISPGGYLVVKRNESKLTLRNTDGKLVLYNQAGNLVHKSAFYGTAPEGKSYNFLARRSPARRDEGGSDGRFFFADPTPGAANALPAASELSLVDYPAGTLIHSAFPDAGVFGMAFGVALIFAALAIYVIKKNNDLQELFFGGHEEIR